MAAQAEQYSQISQHQEKDGLNLIDKVCIVKGSKVLDLGCGTGYLSSVLAGLVGPQGRVIGVDPDKDRIQVATEKYSSENIVFMEGSSDNFPADQYDLVFSNYVLHWIKDKKSAFYNIYQSLRSGGRFAFHDALELAKLHSQLINLMDPSRVRDMYDMLFFETCEVYEKLAKQSGFSVEYKDTTELKVVFPSIEFYIDWMCATTHGVFDPAMIDKAILESFSKSYEGKPVDCIITCLSMILVKP